MQPADGEDVARLEREIARFAGLRVAVVGDAVCDHDLLASPQRLSREAPVMVLRHEGERFGAGGAANVARNLAALGARVVLLGTVGRDAPGRELRSILERAGIDVTRLALEERWRTPTKTRVLAAEPRRYPHQVLRIDREPEAPLDAAARARIARELAALVGELDALVLSDYGYGALGPELGAAVGAHAAAGAPAVLDPRRDIDSFPGLAALTPNVGELAAFTGRTPEALEDPRELARAAGELVRRSRARLVLVTRGNSGMALFGRDLPPSGAAVPACGAGEVTDVCGAGDTASAVFALGLAAGLSPERAMGIANAASGVVVMESGAAVCPPEALVRALARAPVPVALEAL